MYIFQQNSIAFGVATRLGVAARHHSNGLKLCMPMASAILADINMRFSHYLMFSDSTQTQSAALASMTHPASKLRWIKPANLEQTSNLFLNPLRFLSSRVHQQDATKSGRFDEVVDSKTFDFFTFMADSNGEPKTTLRSQAEFLGLKYLEASNRTLSSLERYPLVRYMFKKNNVGLIRRSGTAV